MSLVVSEERWTYPRTRTTSAASCARVASRLKIVRASGDSRALRGANATSAEIALLAARPSGTCEVTTTPSDRERTEPSGAKPFACRGRGRCQLTADSLRAWTARPGSRPARGRERRNPGDVAEARDRSGVFPAEHTGGATARAAPPEFHSIGICMNLLRSRNMPGWAVIRSSSTGCQNIWV